MFNMELNSDAKPAVSPQNEDPDLRLADASVQQKWKAPARLQGLMDGAWPQFPNAGHGPPASIADPFCFVYCTVQYLSLIHI